MKTALILTTINTPVVLELYRQHGLDVAFFVAGDFKSPPDLQAYVDAELGEQVRFYSVEDQKALGYKCSELIGWNCIQRRSIALLEAIRWGAEIIVSVDDDNIPMDRQPNTQFENYFNHFRNALGTNYHNGSFNGLKVSGSGGWFDVGSLLDPVSSHRGYPVDRRSDAYRVEHCVDVRVGVAAGICFGDPDISATTRIENSPTVHRVSELLNSGIVVDSQTKTVFNSQNTAFIRELAPAMFMMPGVGRYDDIYASLICQRVMRERGLHVHFGKPFVWQQRNPHNLMKDLRAEIDGMENVERFAAFIDSVVCYTGTALNDVRCIFTALKPSGLVPAASAEVALAFLEDIEQAL